MDTTGQDKVDLSLMEPIFERYIGQRGTIIPILQKTQALYGYLPMEAIEHIANQLDIALGKVYAVATFYSQFYLERRGRHVLKLCDGTACHVKGEPVLANAIEREFGIAPGETTEDGQLTLEIVYCLGSCALAPVAVFDDEVMGRVNPDKLVRIVKDRLAQAESEKIPIA